MRYAEGVKKGKKQHPYEKLNDKVAKLVDQLSEVHGALSHESENLWQQDGDKDEQVTGALLTEAPEHREKEAAAELIHQLREELYYMRGERDDLRAHMIAGLRTWDCI